MATKRRSRRPRGYVRHLGGDRYELRVPVKDPTTGKHRHKSRTVSARDMRDAEKQLAKMFEQIRPDAGSRTVRDSVYGFLAASAPDKAPRTLDEQRRVFRLHVDPVIGRVPVDRLEAWQLDDLYASMRRNGKAAGTVRHAHNLIRSSLEWARKRHWCHANVADDASPPPVRRTATEAAEVDDLEPLLLAIAATGDERGYVLTALAIATGARTGELCGLQWRDVDWASGYLKIERAATKPDGGATQVKATKTYRPRLVALDDPMLRLLDRHCGWCQRAGFATGAGAFVFPYEGSLGDRPDNPRRYTAVITRARRKAGLGPVTLRKMRHLAASVLIDEGFSLVEVSAQLGHARTSTTTDIYAHLIKDKRKARAVTLGSLVRVEG